MELNQAKEILGEIFMFYPNFNQKNLTSQKKKKAAFYKSWIQKLMEGDYESTKQKLSEYILSSQYPPAIADILVIKPEIDTEDPFEADRKAVAEELADPRAAKVREEKLKKLKEMVGGWSSWLMLHRK